MACARVRDCSLHAQVAASAASLELSRSKVLELQKVQISGSSGGKLNGEVMCVRVTPTCC
jgi:hypothetical protein